jgi:hypothetical protein
MYYEQHKEEQMDTNDLFIEKKSIKFDIGFM